MSITFIHNFNRPSTSIPWLYETPLWTGILANVVAEFDAFANSGRGTRSRTVSSDGLTCTTTNVYNDMSALSDFMTIKSLWYDNTFVAFGNISTYTFTTSNTFVAPFTETVVYNFPTENTTLQSELLVYLNSIVGGVLAAPTTVSNTASSITAVYNFSGSEEYDEKHGDRSSLINSLLPELVANGVTRTRVFANA
jgi:hypothetical protein